MITYQPQDLQEILLDELGYIDSPGFERSGFWKSRRPIPGVDSVYSVQSTPIAYFSQLNDASPEAIFELHRRVWNESKIPLLYVFTPQEIRIYNSYALPATSAGEVNDGERLLRSLSNLAEVMDVRQIIRQELDGYKRLNLETGAFWSTSDGQRIKRESRADTQLLQAMDQVRRQLISELPNHIAYSLIGRSIFIRYLEDRRFITPDEISNLVNGKNDNYRSVLGDINLTYLLFDRLNSRFNGDLFPVEQEERKFVEQKHLLLIMDFLNGTDLDTGQGSFWPYDFEYIPIETISGIYDTFLNNDKRQELGAYYTPLAYLFSFVSR